ncbi:MAG: hypothetical protein C6W54_04210 [Bacillaceae bacterium]|jgi:Adenine-specific DNA methylase containing a Zn-ribbon|nr:MAG: hypothetical protein C6W54_04210 [Bacillaceae bacterium]RZI52828.1 hypothetical protein EW027_02105 [Aeribacillus pallidus]
MHPYRAFPPFRQQPLIRPFFGGGYHPFWGQPPVQQWPIPPRGGLQSLFSRFLPSSTMHAGSIPSSGAVQSLTNPANLSNMLTNVQKVLGVAQQVTPMVQQYGPLIRNLPAMFKIYRELKNADTDSSEEDDIKENSSSKRLKEQTADDSPSDENTSGESKPKLYI